MKEVKNSDTESNFNLLKMHFYICDVQFGVFRNVYLHVRTADGGCPEEHLLTGETFICLDGGWRLNK